MAPCLKRSRTYNLFSRRPPEASPWSFVHRLFPVRALGGHRFRASGDGLAHVATFHAVRPARHRPLPRRAHHVLVAHDARAVFDRGLLREWEPAARYLFAAGFALVAGALLRFLRIEPGRLNRRQALAVTGFSWIVLALFASIPLYFSGHYGSYLDALFDGVSGLTTTGASIIVDLDHLSNADNMFRFMEHLIGGLGLIVVALSIGLFGKRAGSSLFTSEGRNEHVVPNVIRPPSSSRASPRSSSCRRRSSSRCSACSPAWSPCARFSMRSGFPSRGSSPAASRR